MILVIYFLVCSYNTTKYLSSLVNCSMIISVQVISNNVQKIINFNTVLTFLYAMETCKRYESSLVLVKILQQGINLILGCLIYWGKFPAILQAILCINISSMFSVNSNLHLSIRMKCFQNVFIPGTYSLCKCVTRKKHWSISCL
jgi:hypothetical protein